MPQKRAILVAALAVWVSLAFSVDSSGAQEPGEAEKLSQWLADWSFMTGSWKLVEKRYGFEGELIQTNTGQARFERVMQGQRIEESQSLNLEDGGRSTALQLFVYDPRSDEVEIARTDSGHYGFWVIIGKPSSNGMELVEKHPNPGSEVTRRIAYSRTDENHFRRQLEFSTDEGKTFFVRSEWIYSRE